MTRLYTSLVACLCLVCATMSNAQNVVTVPANLDGVAGSDFTYLNNFVNRTLGATPDTNATYRFALEAGGVYFWVSRETWAFDIEFSSIGNSMTMGRPFLGRLRVGGGDPSDMYRGTGSISFDGLEIELGEEGTAGARYEFVSIRPQGKDYSVNFNDCVLYKTTAGLARCEGPGASAKVTNCHIYDIGDYGLLQGNGRIIDIRNIVVDSIIIKNNYIHNILDRIYIGLRQTSANYVEISSNTVFNHVGRHGLIQLKNTKVSKINNNLFINPGVMGSSPRRADEQINFKNERIYNFTLDTIVSGASAEMRNNNVFYTQDVLDFYNSIDSVSKPFSISPTLVQLLGDTSNAIFRDPVTLANVPGQKQIIDYARDTYTRPGGTDLTSIIVEDISLAGTEYDRGYLFDFSKFDPCYSPTSRSATAANGAAVGATWLCDDLVNSIRSAEGYNSNIQLSIAPNPAAAVTNFKFLLTEDSKVSINVLDVSGRTNVNAFDGFLTTGSQNIEWTGANNLAAGLYLVQISTNQGRMIKKMTVQ